MEKFKSAFSGCVFVKDDNGRCYIIDNAMRYGEYIKKKAKYRISQKDFDFHKALHEQMLAKRSG